MYKLVLHMILMEGNNSRVISRVDALNNLNDRTQKLNPQIN